MAVREVNTDQDSFRQFTKSKENLKDDSDENSIDPDLNYGQVENDSDHNGPMFDNQLTIPKHTSTLGRSMKKVRIQSLDSRQQ